MKQKGNIEGKERVRFNMRWTIIKILVFIIVLTISFSLIFYINEKGYSRISEVVADYNRPNHELNMIRDLRDEVTNMLNFQQYEVFLNHDKSLKQFKKEGRIIHNKLDSLKVLMSDNNEQLEQINKVDSLLTSRNLIFSTYLKVRFDFDTATNLQGKFGNIGKVLSSSVVKKDTNTTLILKYENDPIEYSDDAKNDFNDKEHRTKIDTPTLEESSRKFHILPKFLRRDDKPSPVLIENQLPPPPTKSKNEDGFHLIPAFIRNIFKKSEPPKPLPLVVPGKEKPKPESVKPKKRNEPKLVAEQKQSIDYKYDTIQIAKRDSLLSNIQLSLEKIQRRKQENQLELRSQEILLINANDQIIGQILSVVRRLENKQATENYNQNFSSQNMALQSIVINKVILWVVSFLSLSLSFWLMYDFIKVARIRKRLEVAKREAEFHSSAKQIFLANMSHEIRTPLQSIVGYAELLNEKDKSKEIKAINNSSKYLLHIVNEILDYDKIISGKYSFEEANFSISEVVNDVWNICLLNKRSKNLELICDFQFDEETLLGDAFRLKQILLNLLNNAIKYTKEGSVILEAETFIKGDQIILSFEITDTGCGIPEDKQEIIFHKYEQSSKTHFTKGSGLGLSIVNELVKGQNGTITLVSEVNQGSSFRVEIPYKKPNSAEVLDAKFSHSNVNFIDGKIFFIEDDRIIRQLIETYIRGFVKEYRIFENVESFYATNYQDVDCLVSDVRLDKMSGTELVKRLRITGFEKRCIALTAQALKEEHDEIYEAGFDDILVKPFTKSSLRESLLKNNPKITIYRHEDALQFSNLKNLTNDQELIQKIKLDFYQDTKCEIKKLREIEAVSFRKDANVLVHRIAGRLLQMGMTELGERWRNMEHQIQIGEIDAKSEYFSHLLKDLESKISQQA